MLLCAIMFPGFGQSLSGAKATLLRDYGLKICAMRTDVSAFWKGVRVHDIFRQTNIRFVYSTGNPYIGCHLHHISICSFTWDFLRINSEQHRNPTTNVVNLPIVESYGKILSISFLMLLYTLTQYFRVCVCVLINLDKIKPVAGFSKTPPHRLWIANETRLRTDSWK